MGGFGGGGGGEAGPGFDLAVQAAVVEPVDVLQGGELDVVEALPRPSTADELGLVQADEGLGGGVVVGVAPAADAAQGAGGVVLDLRAVTFFDSAAIHALVRLAERFPGTLQVIPSAQVHRVLDISGLWRFQLDPQEQGEAQGWARALPVPRMIAVPCSWNDLFDAALRADDSTPGYPPYNIEKTGDDTYRIMMAVAGFGANDVEITAQENLLVVSGNLGEPREGVTYLYRGIATRAFERRFSLADHVKVVGATLAEGVLQVDLERELPAAMKPRRITVESKPASGTKMIEGKKVVEAKKAA